jgi:broad specificity phosphatase PhoE
MKLVLITHAHTEQAPGVAADEWTLSARGLEQASALANAPFWEEVERLVVSSEPKSWLTVEGVAGERRLPVWVDCRFDEIRRGSWVENYPSQVATSFAEPDVSISGWESCESVRVRALAGIADLRKRFPNETVALVGHGICLSIMRTAFLGHSHVDFSTWQRLSFASFAVFGGDSFALISDFALSSTAER